MILTYFYFLRYIVHLLKSGNKKDAQTGRTTKPYTRKHFSGMQFKFNSTSRASWSSRTSVITLRAGQENYVNHFIYSRTRTKCLTINGISATLRTADPQRSCLYEPCPLSVDYIINRL